jgi:PAS domain S-box-containing protein
MDAVITLDAEQRIVLFSPAAEQMFGCTAADAVGRPIDRFIPERFRAAHRDHIDRFGATRATARRMGRLGEVVALRASGEEFPIEASISVARVPDLCYAVVIRDVTERKRAESLLRAGEQPYQSIFAHPPVAMALARMPDFVTAAVNDAFLTQFEFTREEVIGRMSAELGIFEPAAQAEVRERLGRDGAVRDFECTRRTRSGKERGVVLDIVPVDIGGAPHVLTTIRDITAQRRAEQKLAEQATLARLGKMMTAIAHEVRNPLAGIRMVLQILGGRLAEHGSDRADPVAENVTVAVEGDAPTVGGDARQLSRVVLNLLLNAAQAMNGRGRIDIRIRAAESHCEVSVTDSGPGSAPDVRRRLFQPFVTLPIWHSTDTAPPPARTSDEGAA